MVIGPGGSSIQSKKAPPLWWQIKLEGKGESLDQIRRLNQGRQKGVQHLFSPFSNPFIEGSGKQIIRLCQ